MDKIFNRGVVINVPATKVALKINGLNVFGVNSALYAGNAAKTAQNQIRGRLKLDVRPTGGTTEDYALQIRANSAKTSGTFLGIDNETHLTATGAANGGRRRRDARPVRGRRRRMGQPRHRRRLCVAPRAQWLAIPRLSTGRADHSEWPRPSLVCDGHRDAGRVGSLPAHRRPGRLLPRP